MPMNKPLSTSALILLLIALAAFHWRSTGALLNALSLALFAATMAGAALAWRLRERHAAPTRQR